MYRGHPSVIQGWGCMADLRWNPGMIDLAPNVAGHLSHSGTGHRTWRASSTSTNRTTRDRRGAMRIHPGVCRTPRLLVGPSSVHSGLLCRTRTCCEFGQVKRVQLSVLQSHALSSSPYVELSEGVACESDVMIDQVPESGNKCIYGM